jgi:hypothetical protein
MIRRGIGTQEGELDFSAKKTGLEELVYIGMRDDGYADYDIYLGGTSRKIYESNYTLHSVRLVSKSIVNYLDGDIDDNSAIVACR